MDVSHIPLLTIFPKLTICHSCSTVLPKISVRILSFILNGHIPYWKFRLQNWISGQAHICIYLIPLPSHFKSISNSKLSNISFSISLFLSISLQYKYIHILRLNFNKISNFDIKKHSSLFYKKQFTRHDIWLIDGHDTHTHKWRRIWLKFKPLKFSLGIRLVTKSSNIQNKQTKINKIKQNFNAHKQISLFGIISFYGIISTIFCINISILFPRHY